MRILIAEPDREYRRQAADALSRAAFDVVECATGAEGLTALSDGPFDALVIGLPAGDAHMAELAVKSNAEVFRIARNGDQDRLVPGERLLAPAPPETLAQTVFARLAGDKEPASPAWSNETPLPPSPGGLVGFSHSITRVHRLVKKLCNVDSVVLITGETGTGKELVAKAIHDAGPRKNEPFLAINCGCIPENLLESELFGHMKGSFTGADSDKKGIFVAAGKGTLLLDEIGEMPLHLQPKLLRALETRTVFPVGSTTPIPFTARVLAATNRNLDEKSHQGTFRPDLFYRLKVIEVRTPALREHPEDIHPIARQLLTRLSRKLEMKVPRLDVEATRALERYAWPGNVRELMNVLERAMVLVEGEIIGVRDLPPELSPDLGFDPENLQLATRKFEREHIRRALERAAWDKRNAAQRLGIDVSSLYRKMRRYRIRKSGQ